MIGLDSYSKQVFIYLGPILIYISLWIDCLFEIRKIAAFPLAFIAGWLQGHWWGFISRNYVVWPTFLLMNVLIALNPSCTCIKKRHSWQRWQEWAFSEDLALTIYILQGGLGTKTMWKQQKKYGKTCFVCKHLIVYLITSIRKVFLLPYLQYVVLFCILTRKNAIFICFSEISFLGYKVGKLFFLWVVFEFYSL